VASDPWSVLGVDSSASYADARRAYLIRSQILHPDRHQDAGPGVLAEAERAMRELNDAWNTVRSALGGEGRVGPASGASQRGRAPEAPEAELSPEQCLDWVLRRLLDTARAQGDPLLPAEVDRLRLPVAAAPGGRRMEQWLAERRRTLRAAITADSRRPEGAAQWNAAIRVLAESGPRVVFLLLLDSR